MATQTVDRAGDARPRRRLFPTSLLLAAALIVLAIGAAAATDLFPERPFLLEGVALAALLCLLTAGVLTLLRRWRYGQLLVLSSLLCIVLTGTFWWLRSEDEERGSVLWAFIAPPVPVAEPVQTPVAAPEPFVVPAAIAGRFDQNKDLIEQLQTEFNLGPEPFGQQLLLLSQRTDLGQFDDAFLLRALAEDVRMVVDRLEQTAGVDTSIAVLVRDGEFEQARAAILRGLLQPNLPDATRQALLVSQGGLDQIALDYNRAGALFVEAADLAGSEPERGQLLLSGLRAYYREGAMRQDLASLQAADKLSIDLVALGRDYLGEVVPFQLEIARALRLVPDAEAQERAQALLLEAVKTVAPLDAPQMLARLQMERGFALRQAGTASGDAGTLRQAIEALRLAQAPAAGLDTREAGRIENELGLAYRALSQADRAERDSTAAIGHFRQALSLLEDEAKPAELDVVRINLAIALRFAGAARNDRELLDEARVGFEDVLTRLDREKAPLDWAAAQTGLANTLLAIGEHTNDVAVMEAGVDAFKLALEGAQSDGRTPPVWAKTQNALANALQSLGERTNKRATLGEAVTAREGAWILYQFSGLDSYDFYFESRLASQRAYLETAPLD